MHKFFAQWRNGRALVFRPLTWAEYQRFSAALQVRPEMEVYTDIYRAAVLEGPPAEVATAGLVDFVGETLIHRSAYNGTLSQIQHALALKRAELQGNYLLAARAVVGALFHKSDAEMDTWDSETFFDYVARAEFVSGRKIEPADPNAKKSETPRGKRPMPMPTQGIVEQQVTATRDPAPPPEDPAPRLARRPLTPAQQIVVDRMRRS